MRPNLHLQFKFVDRAGRDVYEIFAAEDNKTLAHPLGEARFHPHASEAMVRWVPHPVDEKSEQMELDLADQKHKANDHD